MTVSWKVPRTDTGRGDQAHRKNQRRKQRQIQEISHTVLTTFSLVVWHKLLIIVRYLSWRQKSKKKKKKLRENLPKRKECQVKSLMGDFFLGWDQIYDYLPVSSYFKWYWHQNSGREIEAMINVNQQTHISEIKRWQL